jgi:hypothetical protein
MRSMLLVIAGILVAGPSYGACTKPEAPSCALQTGAFAGGAVFDSCRLEMISYRRAMEALAECHQTDGQAAQEKAARDELEDVLARFNRRARGE